MNPSSSEQLEKKNTNEKKNPRLRNSRKAFVFLLKKNLRKKKKTFRTLCLGGELSEKNFGRKKQKPFGKKKTL